MLFWKALVVKITFYVLSISNVTAKETRNDILHIRRKKKDRKVYYAIKHTSINYIILVLICGVNCLLDKLNKWIHDDEPHWYEWPIKHFKELHWKIIFLKKWSYLAINDILKTINRESKHLWGLNCSINKWNIDFVNCRVNKNIICKAFDVKWGFVLNCRFCNRK